MLSLGHLVPTPHLIHLQDELLLMQEMFKSMDLDGVGKIRWEQARIVMAKMGRKLTDDQFAKLVDRYDVDKNGEICMFKRVDGPKLMCMQATWNFLSFARCTWII